MLAYKTQDRRHWKNEHLSKTNDEAQAQTELGHSPQWKRIQTQTEAGQSLQLKKIEAQTEAGHNPQWKKTQTQTESGHSMQWTKIHLKQACQTLRQNQSLMSLNEDLPVRLVASDRFKLIGCKLPKVGSTNIRSLMYTLDHLSKTKDANEIRRDITSWRIDPKHLGRKQLSELQRKLNTYTKFMFIRDPIERMVSAYRDRKPWGWFQEQTLPFNEWLVSVLNIPTKKLNRHLVPFNIWCQPCSVKYDFVGQLRNFDEDMNTILESVGARNLVILPQRNRTGYREESSSDVVDMYKRNIPKSSLKKMYEKYYIDYFLFGFPRPY